MRVALKAILGTACMALTAVPMLTGQTSPDQSADRVFQREAQEVTLLKQYSPVMEIYIQDLKSDQGHLAPEADHYYLGRASFGQGTMQGDNGANPNVKKDRKEEKKEKEEISAEKIDKKHAPGMIGELAGAFPKESVQQGFMKLIYVDPLGFDRNRYHLDYVRREFLGEVRCLVFDAMVAPGLKGPHFQGRIWVEDKDYTIVRFNGEYFGDEGKIKGFGLRLDSWRENIAPNVWAPGYIFSVLSDPERGLARFEAQSTFWSYNPKRARTESDRTEEESLRAQDREHEDEAMDRMESAALLAPAGEVDKVLDAVMNNIEVGNNLDIEPEPEGRVLMTSTLECFNIGHTVVISRGLLDMLPDEGALAAVLAHEMAHILAAHPAGEKWSYRDWSAFPPEDSFNHFEYPINPQDEDAANKKALELLKSSAYKDLWSGGSFLHVVDQYSKSFPNLIGPHVEARTPMASAILSTAQKPQGAPEEKQLAALPIMGTRIRVDLWTDQIELRRNKPGVLPSVREVRPFEIRPFHLYLTRWAPPTAVPAAPAKAPDASGTAPANPPAQQPN
jgi:hypothetical protein